MKKTVSRNKRVQHRSEGTPKLRGLARLTGNGERMPSRDGAARLTGNGEGIPGHDGAAELTDNGAAYKPASFFSKEAHDGSTLNYYHLFWIFVIASFIGLALETVYHFIVFGGLESRAGLVWGPFSPLYGIGAVLFTLVSRGKQVERKSRAIIVVFLSCMFVGATLEFVASWVMQNFFGVVAWDYSEEVLNIGGRTSLIFSIIWGLLGTAWICWFLPVIIRLIDRIPEGKHTLVTGLLSIFMLFNILTTVIAVERAYERSVGIPEQGQIDVFMDMVYNDEVIASLFENATINPDSQTSEESSAEKDGAASE